MPFPQLFEAISKEASPEAMKLVNDHYDTFKVSIGNSFMFFRLSCFIFDCNSSFPFYFIRARRLIGKILLKS
jgi:hypothetical protein